MKIKINKTAWFLLVIGMAVFAAGCESCVYDGPDRQAGALSPSFPPAPSTPQNDPDAHARG
jgi:hypothetical protein